jgi:DNA-binding IclR family transcriptional regulator
VIATEAVLAQRWSIFHDLLVTTTGLRSVLALPLPESQQGLGGAAVYFTDASGAGRTDPPGLHGVRRCDVVGADHVARARTAPHPDGRQQAVGGSSSAVVAMAVLRPTPAQPAVSPSSWPRPRSTQRYARPVSADHPSVLGKAVAILWSFGPDEAVLSLAELTRRTGLAKPTVHRMASDLVELRLLDRADGGYRLSGGLFELGMRAATERSLLELAMPFLQDLYERTHETVHLGVAEGAEVVYVAKIGGHRQAESPSRTGGRMPMHCTAIGKVLAAYADPDVQRTVLAGPLARRTAHTVVAPGLLRKQFDRARETGIAFEHEESRLGLQCVAAPVLDQEGRRALAAISVTGPTGRFRPESHVAAVRAAATGLGNVLSRRDTRP